MPVVLTLSAATTTNLPEFVSELLRDQQELTAVERFAQVHGDAKAPLQSRYYRSLLPATPPQPGEQYGFEVDLDRCSGCKACVTACHALNGLDDRETWRDVGLLVGRSAALAVLQHVTSACHHCVEPACQSACPTLAYEKDSHTGIVKHLDDQCFGCQYCILACPYEAPKFNAQRGIIRKCDMCSTRLTAGEAPACVQACPHEAIRITVVNITEARQRAVNGVFLPQSPDPQHSVPTTRYLSQRMKGELRAGDEAVLHPEHAHWPLIAMLLLSQAAVGLMLAALFIAVVGVNSPATSSAVCLSWVLGFAGIIAATMHLGRPWLAYRAVLGWRTSWLSREVIAFAVFQAVATAAVISAVNGWRASLPIIGCATVAGLAGVFCSVMIYAVTPRPLWRFSPTAVKFFGTTLQLGGMSALLLKLQPNAFGANMTPWLAAIVSLTAMLKLIVESRQRHSPANDALSQRASDLLYGPLANSWHVRGGLALLCGVLGPWAAMLPPSEALPLLLCFSLGCVIAECLERWLFFVAAAAPRMPGGIAA